MVTSATSRTRTGTPSSDFTTTSAISRVLVVRARPWTRSMEPAVWTLPPPTLRLFAETASITSSNAIPCFTSRTGSMRTWYCFS